jgi:ketosteroid isomerase-like protein
MDITHRASGQRNTMQELGVYEVKDGKIVKEQFFYDPKG